MRGHSNQACTPSRSCHARFVQIYAFKSVREVDALKFGTHLDQATRTAANKVNQSVDEKTATDFLGSEAPLNGRYVVTRFNSRLWPDRAHPKVGTIRPDG